jgi:hypothetical protein
MRQSHLALSLAQDYPRPAFEAISRDPGLAIVVKSWLGLPHGVRARIVAMVIASKSVEGG